LHAPSVRPSRKFFMEGEKGGKGTGLPCKRGGERKKGRVLKLRRGVVGHREPPTGMEKRGGQEKRGFFIPGLTGVQTRKGGKHTRFWGKRGEFYHNPLWVGGQSEYKEGCENRFAGGKKSMAFLKGKNGKESIQKKRKLNCEITCSSRTAAVELLGGWFYKRKEKKEFPAQNRPFPSKKGKKIFPFPTRKTKKTQHSWGKKKDGPFPHLKKKEKHTNPSYVREGERV